jgi:glycosyltransferase involved in cell wall biosynthesis
MNFDILITTRNRPAILATSVPLMLSQSPRPARLVVVDASDDHDIIARILQDQASRFNVPLTIIKSQPGIAYQRNIGLQHVHSPVVMMPDDDSLWFPGYSDAIMRIYEKDEAAVIGTICGLESPELPPSLSVNKPYRMAWKDRIPARILRLLGAIDVFFPEPIMTELTERLNNVACPSWLAGEDAALAVDFSGFKASFRSDVVRHLRYDELLGAYSLFEDRELLLRMLDRHLSVCAPRARVYHYRHPAKRVDDIEWGVIQILNRAYVVCKHAVPGSLSRRRLKRYSYYKAFRYLVQAVGRGGRRRFIGAWRALSCVPQLLTASPADLPRLYVALRNDCVGRA